MHYKRWHKNGSPGDAVPLKASSGSGHLTLAGYRMVRAGGRNMFEHRVVMEQALGRALEPFENIHHKNGVRHDNRPENLELWTQPQPQGQRPEDLVAWVIEHYRDLVEAELRTES